LEQGSTAQEACKKAMDYVLEKTGGRGGIIMIDQKGEIGYFFNTSTMAWATASGKGVRHGIRKGENFAENYQHGS